MSPTERTVKLLRDTGYCYGIVEKYNHFVKIRQDYCGFADIIAYHPDHNGTLAIQATSDSNISARVNKIKTIYKAQLWVNQPDRELVVWGWGKKGARGQKKTWQLRSIKITPEMFT